MPRFVCSFVKFNFQQQSFSYTLYQEAVHQKQNKSNKIKINNKQTKQNKTIKKQNKNIARNKKKTHKTRNKQTKQNENKQMTRYVGKYFNLQILWIRSK